MNFGLKEHDINIIKNTIHLFKEIDDAIIFGSRAMGNYKKGSDVDIALKGKRLSGQTVASVNESLNELCPLPYFFDVIHYDSITNQRLRDHIDEYGIPIENRDRAQRQ